MFHEGTVHTFNLSSSGGLSARSLLSIYIYIYIYIFDQYFRSIYFMKSVGYYSILADTKIMILKTKPTAIASMFKIRADTKSIRDDAITNIFIEPKISERKGHLHTDGRRRILRHVGVRFALI